MHRLFFSACFSSACLIAGAVHADISDIAPLQACNFLTGNGLPTTTWMRQADGDYRCVSPPINIGPVNSIAYHVAGTATRADAIGLTVVVDAPADAAAVQRRLKDLATALARKLGCTLPDDVAQAITIGQGAQQTMAGRRRITAQRTATGNGYTLDVVFE